MSDQTEVEMPALGRTYLTVGSLYDCRNETHVTGKLHQSFNSNLIPIYLV